MSEGYEDILHLPHHVSLRHPSMPVRDRAAQFAPFAALTGYGAAIAETARLTDGKIELGDNDQAELDRRLRLVEEHVKERPVVRLTYFAADEKKTGGAYVMREGSVKRIDLCEQQIVMADGSIIRMADLRELDGELFEGGE